jgi:thiamine-monophosphate kinase
MAGTPLGAVCAAALPGRYTLADELFDAAHRAALALRCPLVGGDIAVTEAEHPSLTVTVFGAPHAGRGPVLRSTARPGDLLFVSGSLGGAWRRGGKRHLTFTPRVELAAAIASAVGDGLTAMIDLSDGLGIDAGRLAAASGVRIDIEGERVPIAEGAEGLEAAMGEGEDYELAFTVSPGFAPRLESVARAAGVALTRVGAVSAGSGCFVRTRDGETRDASAMGFDHGADS